MRCRCATGTEHGNYPECVHFSLRRGSGVLTLLAAAALTATACSSGDQPVNAASPTDTQAPGPTYDTTGLPAPDAWKRTPIVVVKIDNEPGSHPHVGVTDADLIIEEPVEGGDTRFAAFYQSHYPTAVGPVRSVRKSDIGLVQPVRPLVLTSGGFERTMQLLQAARVNVVPDDGENPIYSRDTSRVMPHNLMADTALALRSEPAEVPQQAYLDFGTSQQTTGTAATRVDVRFSPAASETWRYDSASRLWARKEVDNVTYRVANLVLLTVKLGNAGYRDAAGSPVPVVISTGTGTGYLMTDTGTMREITWSKRGDTARWQFADADGTPLQVPAGRTWISLLPKSTSKVSVR